MSAKIKDQKLHARKRLKQRYDGNRDLYRKLCDIIIDHGGIVIQKQSLNKTIRVVTYDNTIYYVVYDKKRKQIATFLTEDMVKKTCPEGFLFLKEKIINLNIRILKSNKISSMSANNDFNENLVK